MNAFGVILEELHTSVKVIPTQTRIRAFRVITYFIFTEV
jgi:hypothetical protein